MKYLHLINDEKFTDFIIALFEECNGGNNVFLIGIADNQILPKYTRINKNNVIFRRKSSRKYFKFINECEFDVLFVHLLDYNKERVILRLKNDPIVIWHAWGADIYKTKFYQEKLYQPNTEILLNSLQGPWEKLKSKYRNIYYYLSFRIPPDVAYRRAVNKVDFCGTVIPDEINILKKWSFFNAVPVEFSNISIEYDFLNNDIHNDHVNGNGIVIGNSTDPTANHLDCFNRLNSLEVMDRKIIVPLTYGGNIKYRNAIVSKGEEMFGENFLPLLHFMSRKEYIDVLKTGNVAIMNHNRQQAVGNIIVLLWMGCKIFLSEENVTLAYLKRKGFFVYSFQNELDEKTINTPLTNEQVLKNKELIYKEHGHKYVLMKAKRLINTVSEKCH